MHHRLEGEIGRFQNRTLALRGSMDDSLTEHRAILAAIRLRDADRAAALTADHIRVPAQRLQAALRDDAPVEPVGASLGEPAEASLGEPAEASLGEPAEASLGEPAEASLGEPAEASLGEPAEASLPRPRWCSPDLGVRHGSSLPTHRSPRSRPPTYLHPSRVTGGSCIEAAGNRSRGRGV